MGNYTNAYATVTPNQQNIGNAIDDVENQGFKYREEQRLVEKEQEAKKKEKQDRLLKAITDAPQFVPSGVKTIDEAYYLGTKIASDKYYDATIEFEQLYNKTNKSPEEEKRLFELGIIKTNLFNAPEAMKKSTETLANQIKEYGEGVKQGIYLPDENIFKKSSNALTGYVPGFDEKGNYILGFVDADGDGINDVASFEDINNRLVINPVKMMDPFKLAQTFAKDFKLDETSTQKDYTTYDNKFVPKEELEATIGNLITPESLATEAYKRGLPLNYQWSDEEVSKLKKDLINHTNTYIGTTSKVKKDLAAEDRDARLEFDKKKQAEELAFKKKKEANDAANEKAKIALAKAKAFGGTSVDDTPLNIDGTKMNSIQKGAKLLNEKVVIPDGSVGFALQGDGVKRVIGTGDKAIVEDADAVFYDLESDRLIIRANRINGFSDGSTEQVKPEEVYYNSDENASDTWEFFQKRKDNKGNYYKNLHEVIAKYKKIAGLKNRTTPAKGVGSKYN